MTQITFDTSLAISVFAGSHTRFRDADYQLTVLVSDELDDITERLPSGVYFAPGENRFWLNPSKPAFNFLQMDQEQPVIIHYGVLRDGLLHHTITQWIVRGTGDGAELWGDDVIPEGQVYVIELQAATLEGKKMNAQGVQWHLETHAPAKMSDLFAIASEKLAAAG